MLHVLLATVSLVKSQMSPELLLPGSVMIIKSLFRLAVDREVDVVRFARAIIAFPVDIAFLACSYATARMILSTGASWSAGAIVGIVIVYLSLAVIVVICCSKSDRAFDSDRNLATALIGIGSYALAFAILGVTMASGIV